MTASWIEWLFLRRREVVAVLPGPTTLPAATVLAGVANLRALGYAPSAELVRNWLDGEAPVVMRVLQEVESAARRAVGAHRELKPMYPGFPAQVVGASDLELVLNAVLHYSGDVYGFRWMPGYPEHLRPALDERIERRPVTLVGEQGLHEALRRTLAARAAWSEADRADLPVLYAQLGPRVLDALPERFVIRENLALACALDGAVLDRCAPQITSALDVLRIEVAHQGGDVSLAEPHRFGPLPRRRRRRLMALLEASDLDLSRHPERFKRLAERLHPQEYADRHPRTARAFAELHAGRRTPTVRTQAEAWQAQGRTSDVARLLAAEEPGELARRVDALLRRAPDQAGEVVGELERSAARVSTRVLLQLGAHLDRRRTPRETRIVYPLGQVSKARALDDDRPELPGPVVDRARAVVERILVERFSALPPLGRVHLHPALATMAVPLQVRNASPGLHTLGRGSRLPLATDKPVVRAFVWWRDGVERTDLDLSVALFDETCTRGVDVAYYNLRELGCTHSGDITSAPQGAAEFVDIEPVVAAGHRYAAIIVASYSCQPFQELPDCFAGTMGRASADSGEVFEPALVQHRLDLTAPTTTSICQVIDLHRRELVWCDLGVRTTPRAGRGVNVHDNRATLGDLVRGVVESTPPMLGWLFELHVRARGTLVHRPEDADLRIGPGGDVDPFDATTILADWVV